MIQNPHYANKDSSGDNNHPRNPCPPWNQSISSPTYEKNPHLHEQRPEKPPENTVESIKTRRQVLVQFRGRRCISLPETGEGPHILAKTGNLG
ncbi:LOW QUALITY PROTEIN: hypothetical protein TorRG33x02_213620 [Trema orientale]|uniref:Uncharacterized protein n=1 Tax=Trema orientale TaxID=63057 RepID=A0A2P5EB53_TREOI|nr:LOW QUALITY PROTEIN: hypothetical protein TorRG33x02_213620 [Trema orientale]